MIPALLLLGAVLTFACSMTGRGPDLHWSETHHAYYGWVLAGIGLLGGWPLFTIPGLVLAIDDAAQHALQNIPGWGAKNLSLLHWLYGLTLWRLPWVRKLNAYLDKRAE